MAFSTLLGAFSLIITQIQGLSSYAAVLGRISQLEDAVEQAQAPAGPSFELRDERDGRVAWQRLTLRAPKDGRVLVRELDVSIPYGTRVLIVGPEEAQVALLRATAGIAGSGEGSVVRPGLDQIFFLPERPYLPAGTLRELLVPTGREREVPDAEILAVLRALGAEPVLQRAGGLDVAAEWDDLLSLGEQQLLAFARLLLAPPRFAFIDRPSSALDPERVGRILPLLAQRGISYLVLGSAEDPPDAYDAVLELEPDASWSWHPLAGDEREHAG
jgi:putative ATP-binding cassette transporter